MLMLLALLIAKANGVIIPTGAWIVFTIQAVVESMTILAKIVGNGDE